MATTPTYQEPPAKLSKRLSDSDSTNIVDVYDNSAGAKSVKVEAFYVTTDNTADRILKMYIHDGTNSMLIGSKTIPDLSGTNGATDPRVSLMQTLGTPGADGVPVVWVGAGCKLQVSLDAALASGKFMYLAGRVYTFS